MVPMSSPARHPSPAEQDLQHILGFAQATAQECLAETSAIDPFAVYMDRAGQTVHVTADADRYGSLLEKIECLRHDLKAIARDGGLKASAITYIASVQDRESGQMQDAVAVNLNHRDELSTVVYFPFDPSSERPDWETSFQQAGRSDIFQ